MSEKFHDLHPKRGWTADALDVFQTQKYDDQWAEDRAVEIAGERFAVHRMHPDRMEMETPVLMVGGWNATDEILKENGRAIVAEGAPAIVVNAPHGSAHEIETAENVGKVFEVELRRIQTFMTALDEERIDKIFAIGHSEGAISVLLAAAIFPERFKGVALVNPGGMIADDDPIRLSLRFSRDAIRSWYFAIKQGSLDKKLNIDRRALKSAAHDAGASFMELQSITRTHIYELLRTVRSHDIAILLMHSPDDAVFPFAKMRATIQDMKENPREDIGHLLTGIYSVGGDHNTFVRNPSEYTRPLVRAFKSLDKKT